MTDHIQFTEADLETMTPNQINDARRAGKLDDLLAGKKTENNA